MVFSPRQMWWLNLALVVIMMMSLTSWGALDVPVHVVAWINAGCTFAIGILHFIIQGTIPGTGMSARDQSNVPGGSNALTSNPYSSDPGSSRSG